jgi:hypothetical protein
MHTSTDILQILLTSEKEPIPFTPDTTANKNTVFKAQNASFLEAWY